MSETFGMIYELHFFAGRVGWLAVSHETAKPFCFYRRRGEIAQHPMHAARARTPGRSHAQPAQNRLSLAAFKKRL